MSYTFKVPDEQVRTTVDNRCAQPAKKRRYHNHSDAYIPSINRDTSTALALLSKSWCVTLSGQRWHSYQDPRQDIAVHSSLVTLQRTIAARRFKNVYVRPAVWLLYCAFIFSLRRDQRRAGGVNRLTNRLRLCLDTPARQSISL
jgi:hypothetical protein